MKIIKGGRLIAELPSKPKNFDGGIVKGWLLINIGDREVKLAHYGAGASDILRQLRRAYLSDEDEFILPKGD